MPKAQDIDLFKGQPRLPKFAIPRRYDLKLKPDLVGCEFAGTVDVVIDIVEETKFLVLNAADLVVVEGSVSFRRRDSSEVRLQICVCFSDGSKDFLCRICVPWRSLPWWRMRSCCWNLKIQSP